ncbi:glucosidase 2 subunit beta-like [Saccostrea echinata]|uniref:glucosidase 2 subunit beta-like n=1 Tax=Saccostrea echinata TaxID=191078 RepID=UPI002A81ACD0|nr:glucosidase 2 subunit beta-like [Saccostrea echinata]
MQIFLWKRPRIIVLAVIAAGIFMTFQFFSLEALFYAQKRAAVRSYSYINENERKENLVKEFNNEEVVTVNVKEPNEINHLIKTPRGVHKDDMHLYTVVQQDEREMFRCVKSRRLIPYSWINDDYCDCEDSSDEPGTSACPNGRFYCTLQLPDQKAASLPSSGVNDGICDCCDGSDEWAARAPPKSMRHKGKNIVLQAPCQNHCDTIAKISKENEQIRKMGQRLKRTYLIAAQSLSNKEVYGPEGVFYKLSQKCFSHKAHPYEYKICPFQSVTQEQFPTQQWSLGRKAVWKQRSHGQFLLEMSGGDGVNCPGRGRQSLILFLCGISDRVVELREDQRCEYLIKFATPAAC